MAERGVMFSHYSCVCRHYLFLKQLPLNRDCITIVSVTIDIGSDLCLRLNFLFQCFKEMHGRVKDCMFHSLGDSCRHIKVQSAAGITPHCQTRFREYHSFLSSLYFYLKLCLIENFLRMDTIGLSSFISDLSFQHCSLPFFYTYI